MIGSRSPGAPAAELDTAANLTLDPDVHFDEVRELSGQLRWRVPAEVFNAVTQRTDTV